MEPAPRGDHPTVSDSTLVRREREQDANAVPPPPHRNASACPPTFANLKTSFPLDDTKTFDYPGIEPTLNQTNILRGMKDNDIGGCLSSTANHHVDTAGPGEYFTYVALPHGSNVADNIPGLHRVPKSASADAADYLAVMRSADINYKVVQAPYDARGYVTGYNAEPLRAISNGAARVTRSFPGGQQVVAGFPFGLHPHGTNRLVFPNAYGASVENRENVPAYPGSAGFTSHASRATSMPPFSHYEPKARAAGSGSRSCDLEMWQNHPLQSAGHQLLMYPKDDEATADLKRKLGAAELEVRTLRDSLLKVQNDHSAQLKKMEEKIKNRDKHMESLKKRCQKSAEERDEKERKLQSMDRYLSALPTMEDHQRDLQQMTELETLRSSLQHRVEALEGRLRDRDREILDRKTKEEELMAAVQSLQHKLDSLEQSKSPPSGVDVTQLRQENCNLKKIVNILKKKLEALTEEHGDKIRLLEEQVVHEEEENAALRDALGERDSGLQALQSAVKELAAQNQKLLDGHLSLKEELQETMDVSRDHDRLSQVGSELQAQLSHCFDELRSLCRVVCQRVHGHDPNLSLLLGIQSLAHDERDAAGGGGADRRSASSPPMPLASTLDGVRQLRREVDEARAVLSERYAEDVGENCAVQ
ncbi:unnamed protein product [Lampetra planeri]